MCIQCTCSVYCNSQFRDIYVGEPDVVDQLILGLGLGSTGQHISTSFPDIIGVVSLSINNTTTFRNRFTRSDCDTRQVCHHVTTQPGRSKQ